MKVLLTKKFYESDFKYISERISDGVELLKPKSYDEEGMLELADEAEVLFGGFLSDALLAKASNLRFIQIPWTGVDNLDYELLSKHEVVICNSHSNSGVVAEHAVALMLDAAKKLSYHDKKMREGDWNRLFPDNKNEITPFSKSIFNSDVGLVGFGAIAQKIHQYLSGFNCKFKVFTRTGMNRQGVENASFFKVDDFLIKAENLDYVFICVPLTEETKKMVNEEFLSVLLEKCIFINISRGSVIDQEALYEALKNKSISFAAIDTWYNYPNIKNQNVFPSEEYDFHLLDNLVMSPHRAGYVESGFPHLDDAIENLNLAKEGKPLKNIVSLQQKY